MSDQAMAERRAYPRLAVRGGAFFYHPASGRHMPGRTTNISRGGLWMQVPPYAPLRAGQEIQFVELPQVAGQSDGPLALASERAPLPAIVVRVDPSPLLTTGQIGVGVRFQISVATA